jgi:formylglycine-generating enzyme required for sulfatase activity
MSDTEKIEQKKIESGGWRYEPGNDGGITVTHYKGDEEALTIPEQIDGKTVTRIGKSAFSGSKYNAVTIPGSVTEICEGAFNGSVFLRHLIIPDSVVTIGEKAFNNCKLLCLTLGRGVKNIGVWAFSDNQLTELVIPDNVTFIDESAFAGNFLEKLILGRGITVIPKKAFHSNKFKEVIIPDNIEEIGERAFVLSRETRAIVPDSKINAWKGLFGHAKLVKASDYAKETQAVISTGKGIEVDERSKIIDLSNDNPAPCGRGWTFADGVYTVYDWANVTVTGDNKKSGRRIVVVKGARKVNITLQDATMWADTKPVTGIDRIRMDDKIPLQFHAPVTLWLKGTNTIATDTTKYSRQGKNFIGAGVAISCKDLIIAGTGSLIMTGSIICGSIKNEKTREIRNGDFTVYGGKIDILFGIIRSNDITFNGGELFVGVRDEKEFAATGIHGSAITVNGGIITVTTHLSSCMAINGEMVTVNGGAVTATDKSWTYDGDPPYAPAICARGRSDRSTGIVKIELEPVVIVNGGNVTAMVPNTSAAPAIGIEATQVTGKQHRGKLIMNGGTVFVSQLEGRAREHWPVSRTNTDGVCGGVLTEDKKTIFKGPDKAPPPAVPEFTPDIFEYVDERAGYMEIDGFRMMRVRSGTFIMGAAADQGKEVKENEKPAHQVTLTRDYYMCIVPVTQNQWVEVMDSNPSSVQRNAHSLQTQTEWAAILGAKPSGFAETGFYPVECVSFINVLDFISKLNNKTGKNFRLPTEAEWEYAARGGQLSKGFMYAGSNNIKEVAIIESLDIIASPTAVKDCNELGLYDMSGCVYEWVNDYYSDYTTEPKTDPAGPASPGENPDRVIRGVGRISSRKNRRESRKDKDFKGFVGFRLVLAADTAT